jgi:hypothetical protein
VGPTEAEFVIIDAVNEVAVELGVNAAAVALRGSIAALALSPR